jgi:cell division protein FtsW
MVTDKRTSPSLKERRLETLRRTGVADRHRVATEKPSAAFYWIFIIVSSFVMLGLVMVLSSSSVTNLHSGGSAWGMFQRQLVWAGLGGIAMWAAFAFPYETWRKTFLLQSVVASVVILNVVVILRGAIVNGARAWLDMGPFRMQPSEFMKIAVVLFCANLLSHRHRSVQISSIVLWPMIVALGVSAGLCALQKDFGGSLIFGGIVLVMMIIAGLPKRQVFTTTVVLLVSGAFVLKFAGNASARMLAFMDLEGTKEDGGYQVYQSLLSIANGGWSGTGIGSGTSKWGYVPLAYSDFIFSVIAEELGIFGSLMVIGGFLALVVFGLQVALSAPDTHGAFIAGGISAWFGVQALVNVGGVVGALPMTGLTLPFLSYGGSSLIASMAAAGLLLNVARAVKTSQ